MTPSLRCDTALQLRHAEVARGAAQVEHLGGALDHAAVVNAGVGGDDHGDVDALERVVERRAAELVLGDLGYVRAVVADLGAAGAQELDDLQAGD